MIVCSCNVLSDRDVRSAIEAERPNSVSQVYGCLGCSARCGRCAQTIRRLVDETLANVRAASCDGCTRSCNLDRRPSHAADPNCHAGRAAPMPSVHCPQAAT
ncbi:(2Fe-2S)-binding protein [Ensifer adhaerens]|uniref:(2Fe-2S)-binding protein n=1 Tax=Ensifer adhaerens TaxID=106592 RepID=UPI000CF05AA8|nr:(2Fe-2S)-binding protein [Ensifer adhaerens]